MRKFNFIVGALGGLFGGMLLSNKKLRQKLKKADDPSAAAKIIGKEIQRSGQEVAKETQKFVKSAEFQSWWKKMKKNFSKQCKSLQEEAEHIAADASKKARKKAIEAKKIVEKKFG